ncbi:MAG: hypothetical protein ACTSR0_03045 [Candidatus Asgardarchaeia archaeon]
MLLIRFMSKLGDLFKFNFGRILSSIENEELEDALLYIRKKYNVDLKKEELLNSSVLISSSVSILVFLATFDANLPLIVSIFSSIVAFLLSSLYIVNYPVKLLRREIMRFSRYLYLVFSELRLSSVLGISKFDTIRYMAKSNIPEISQMFEGIVKEIICGGISEDVIKEYIERLPPCELRNMISDFFSNSGIEFLRKYDLEYLKEYKRYVSEVENRMIVFYILPIFIVIVSSIFSYHLFSSSYILSILYPSSILLLSKTIETLATRSTGSRLLRGYGEILLEREELKEAIDLTNKIGKMLRSGIPLEISMMSILSEYRGKSREKVKKMLSRMEILEISPKEVIISLSKMFNTPIVKSALIMASSNVKRDDKEFGKIIMMMSKHLDGIKKLLDEESIIYRANQLKSIVIIIVSSLIIGLTSSISPFISNFYIKGLFGSSLELSFDYPFFSSMVLFLIHSYLSGRLFLINFERSKAYVLTLLSFTLSLVSSQMSWNFLVDLLLKSF